MNRVDPWGDLHAVAGRGLLTGNRGCLVDDEGRIVRHHRGASWIICRTRFRDWRHPLDAPRTWTPLFFLDDAVALAAGHRPCALCRRHDHQRYRAALTAALGDEAPDSARALDRRLSGERLARGRGLRRGGDRLLWSAALGQLPPGTVFVERGDRAPWLVTSRGVHRFTLGGWGPAIATTGRRVEVVTPPVSVAALAHGFIPLVHPTAAGA
ncbi:MAG: hypothetical protein ACFCVK_25640 [Acidimicrobiales bacterium]